MKWKYGSKSDNFSLKEMKEFIKFLKQWLDCLKNLLGVKFEIWLNSDPILRNLNATRSLQWYKANC